MNKSESNIIHSKSVCNCMHGSKKCMEQYYIIIMEFQHHDANLVHNTVKSDIQGSWL